MGLLLVWIWILVLDSVFEEKEGYHRFYLYENRIISLADGNSRTIMNVTLNGLIL